SIFGNSQIRSSLYGRYVESTHNGRPSASSPAAPRQEREHDDDAHGSRSAARRCRQHATCS
ncbi:hypothetical protein M9458_047383, partial [Cirrhinus mrigala]